MVSLINVNFECPTCAQKIYVYENYLVNKEGLACPNCSTEFPLTEFEKLKKAIKEISEVVENLCSRDERNRPQPSWGIKLDM